MTPILVVERSFTRLEPDAFGRLVVIATWREVKQPSDPKPGK